MLNPKKLAAALTAGTLLLTLAACGGDSDTKDARAEQTAANGDVFNDEDVDFATAMIPHHAQALAIVDVTRGRDLSAPVQKLTEDVQAAQGPRIETMVDWLTGGTSRCRRPCATTPTPRTPTGWRVTTWRTWRATESDMPGMMTA